MKKEVLRLDHVSVFMETNDILLDNINFSLFEGEINCIFTKENISKLSLIQVLLRKLILSDGHLYVNNNEVITPCDYNSLSTVSGYISINPQLVPYMSVAENLFYFNKSVYKHGILNEKLMYQKATALLAGFNITDICVTSTVRELSASQKHIIEILRTIAAEQQILILEDFTGIYTFAETKKLMDILVLLARRNKSILLFSDQKYGSVGIANRLTILQNKTITSIHNNNPTIIMQLRGKQPPIKQKSRNEQHENNPTVYSSFLHTDYILRENQNPFSILLNNKEITGIFDPDWIYCPEITNILYDNSKYNGKLVIHNKVYEIRNNVAVFDDTLLDNNIFNNMDIWDNIGLLLNSHTITPFGIENHRLSKYYVKEILNTLHMDYLIQDYSRLDYIPHVGYDVQMDINIAKWVCRGPKLIAFINPYPGYDDTNILMRFRKIIIEIQKMGIFCILLARNKVQLQSICDTIINLPELL